MISIMIALVVVLAIVALFHQGDEPQALRPMSKRSREYRDRTLKDYKDHEAKVWANIKSRR